MQAAVDDGDAALALDEVRVHAAEREGKRKLQTSIARAGRDRHEE
jgi:hypothetical protein